MQVSMREFEWRGTRLTVEVRKNGGSGREMIAGGVHSQVEVRNCGNGFLWLDVDGRRTLVHVFREAGRVWVSANGRTEVLDSVVPGSAVAPAARPTPAPASAPIPEAPPSAVCSGAVPAPTTGLVAQVLVSEGDEVEPGRELVLMESMKMLFKVRAPRRGRIRRLACAPGRVVRSGEILAEIEEAHPASPRSRPPLSLTDRPARRILGPLGHDGRLRVGPGGRRRRMTPDELLMDKRLLTRNRRRGLLSDEKIATHLKKLPDRSDNADTVAVPQGEQARRESPR